MLNLLFMSFVQVQLRGRRSQIRPPLRPFMGRRKTARRHETSNDWGRSRCQAEEGQDRRRAERTRQGKQFLFLFVSYFISLLFSLGLHVHSHASADACL